MMASLRRACENWLRIPPAPEPPPGDEATAQIFRAAPSYFNLLAVQWFAKNFALFLGLVMALGAPVLATLPASRRRGTEELFVVTLILFVLGLIIVVAQALIRLAVLRLNFEKRWYVVTDRSLRVREGVFVVREMTVSFANIQDVAVTQGPIERLFGIANVRVTTAGGGGDAGFSSLHQAWFRGITNAEKVRNLILARLRALKDSGLGDPDNDRGSAAVATKDDDSAFLDALRSVREEASALRQTVQQARAQGTSG